MKKNMTFSSYAFRTLEAFKSDSVIKVYPAALSKIEAALKSHTKGYFVGVKNTDVIPHLFLSQLQNHGFIIHTRDKLAFSGRAIDLELHNPITGRHMTGSSSGTAINVFMGINDLGIGTDGGGSVLNPALSLNLYAMISKLFQQESMLKYSKISTDGLEFTPSLGFISKDISIIEEVVMTQFPMKSLINYQIIDAISDLEIHTSLRKKIVSSELVVSEKIKLSYSGLNRTSLMEDLKNINLENRVLVLSEGPIDLLGYGDSIIGHLGAINLSLQELGHKYYSKVINMLGLSAIIVPTDNHAIGFLLVTVSTEEGLLQLLDVAKKIGNYKSRLISQYFDLEDKYLKEGFE